jgi:CheY-like chemotaxis protein
MLTNNGREAVQAFRNDGPFDAILMDVQMPGMDGFQATAAIREMERGSPSHIRIIALTAHALREDRERCEAAGMDAYVPKPIRSAELFAALEGGGAERRPAAPATGGDALPYDHAQALAQSAQGDEALLRELTGIFLENAPVLVEEIARAVLSGDRDTAGRQAHALKGSAANFCAQGTVEAARRLEELAREGSEAELAAALVALRTELDALCRALADRAEPTA